MNIRFHQNQRVVLGNMATEQGVSVAQVILNIIEQSVKTHKSYIPFNPQEQNAHDQYQTVRSK